ncbi:MAG TPA: glycosyltransferase, partial [Acidimicrobiales bacterium]|nr:glycosyltransferase [Acidimicrobiales bacterium]
DRLLADLAMDATPGPGLPERLAEALAGAELVVVENLCSLPRNPAAAAALAARLAGRPAILHHHDLPWQRAEFADLPGWPPDDPAWVHVTINDVSRRDLARRGVAATTVPNAFEVDAAPGDRQSTRRALGVAPAERVLLQPTRAIARKNVPAAIRLAETLDATYWLVGAAEDGYEEELAGHLREARTRVIRGLPDGVGMAGAYAAADAVALPSTWEGFGNPTIESAVHRRALAVGRYPVAREIAAYGFRWFPADDPDPLAAWLASPDPTVLDMNLEIARRHFSLASLEHRLARVLAEAGWPAP